MISVWIPARALNLRTFHSHFSCGYTLTNNMILHFWVSSLPLLILFYLKFCFIQAMLSKAMFWNVI